jgi:hypothetical protein
MTAGTTDFDSASPWLPGDQLLYQFETEEITASGSVTTGNLPFARGSYVIAADCLGAADSAMPFCQVDMFWMDPTTGLTTGHERWIFPQTDEEPAGAYLLVVGRGPAKAAGLTVTVTNFDTANNVYLDLAVFQSSRTVTRDDWRATTFGNVPNFTTAAVDPPALLLGFKEPASLGAGASVTRLCSPYAGAAVMSVTQTGGQALTWSIQAIDPNYPAADYPNTGGSATSADDSQVTVALPRAPVQVTVTNTGGSASTVSWCLTAQEFAS